MLRRQCEIQSRKQNVSELPNMSELADVSSESSSSERLLKSFRSKRPQLSRSVVYLQFIFDFMFKVAYKCFFVALLSFFFLLYTGSISRCFKFHVQLDCLYEMCRVRLHKVIYTMVLSFILQTRSEYEQLGTLFLYISCVLSTPRLTEEF